MRGILVKNVRLPTSKLSSELLESSGRTWVLEFGEGS